MSEELSQEDVVDAIGIGLDLVNMGLHWKDVKKHATNRANPDYPIKLLLYVMNGSKTIKASKIWATEKLKRLVDKYSKQYPEAATNLGNLEKVSYHFAKARYDVSKLKISPTVTLALAEFNKSVFELMLQPGSCCEPLGKWIKMKLYDFNYLDLVADTSYRDGYMVVDKSVQREEGKAFRLLNKSLSKITDPKDKATLKKAISVYESMVNDIVKFYKDSIKPTKDVSLEDDSESLEGQNPIAVMANKGNYTTKRKNPDYPIKLLLGCGLSQSFGSNETFNPSKVGSDDKLKALVNNYSSKYKDFSNIIGKFGVAFSYLYDTVGSKLEGRYDKMVVVKAKFLKLDPKLLEALSDFNSSVFELLLEDGSSCELLDKPKSLSFFDYGYLEDFGRYKEVDGIPALLEERLIKEVIGSAKEAISSMDDEAKKKDFERAISSLEKLIKNIIKFYKDTISKVSENKVSQEEETLSMEASPKRKKVEKYILDYIAKIVSGDDNIKLYKEMFKSMNDKQFNQFMMDLRDKKKTLSVIIPNGDKKNKVSLDNNMKVAKELKVDFFQQLKVSGQKDTPDYTTPNKYFIVKLPLRRAAQLLSKGISVPEDSKVIDRLTGQVTSGSRSGKITYPEIQLLLGLGMQASLRELLKLRGGDLGAANAMTQSLTKIGKVNQGEINQYSTGVVSTKTLKAYFNAIHIKSTL